MPRNAWNKKQVEPNPNLLNPNYPLFNDVANLARRGVRSGAIKMEQTAEGISLDMDNQITGELQNIVNRYFLNLLTRISGGLFQPDQNYLNSTQIVPLYVPLDIEYTMPLGMSFASEISPRTYLSVVWDLTYFGVMWTFYSNIAAGSLPGISLSNVKVRRMLPIELGGYYAGGNATTLGQAGPFGGAGNTAPVISGTNYRQPGVPQVSLAQGYNPAVVYENLQPGPSQNILLAIHAIKDLTIPQSAIYFQFNKNSTPMMPPDYSGYLPWLFVDWGDQSTYKQPYNEIGLLNPVFAKTGDTVRIDVYALATSNELLLFKGYIAYVAGK